MKLHVSDLWRWGGTVERGAYLFWGVALGLVKYNLDRMALKLSSVEGWLPWHYWIPGDVFGVLSTAPERKRAAATLLLIALPFVHTGVVLTLRRLRSLGWPVGLVILFFVPVVNLLFFAMLSVIPSRPGAGAAAVHQGHEGRAFLARLVPRSEIGGAVAAIGLTALLGTGMVFVFTDLLKSYAWGIFIGIPFFQGLFATLVYTIHEPRSLSRCLGVGSLSILVLAGVLVGLALEGTLCVVMATPIALILSLLGSLVGYVVVRARTSQGQKGMMMAILVCLTPLLLAAEAARPSGPVAETVVDRVVLEAPPAEVWETVKAIDSLSMPKPFLMRIGLPVPLRCTLEGESVGSRRTCIFETGVIDERVVEWAPPVRMRMEIVRSTLPGRHWLAFKEAIYDLREEGGRTVLTRTTTYTSTLEPRAYWHALEAAGIRTMHAYVLGDLRRRLSR